MAIDVAPGAVRINDPRGPLLTVEEVPEKVRGPSVARDSTINVSGVTAPIAIPSAGKSWAMPPAHGSVADEVSTLAGIVQYRPSCTGVWMPLAGVKMPSPCTTAAL